MKQRNYKKISIILSVILVILLLPVFYALVSQGCIPSYSRDELGIYMPYFYADDFEVENGFTDSYGCYRFNLNESEIKKLQADVENNSAWFRFSGDSEDILSLNPVFGPWMQDFDLNVNNCYVALYDFSDKCFVYEIDGLHNCGCAVFDEENGMFYYLEMIW